MPESSGGTKGSTGTTSSVPWSSYIGAAVQGASGILGAALQGRRNKIQRRYEREMYVKNKHDQLSFWNMQNKYNSPQMQMQRLKDAGLNPNLVYGNGADAMSGNLQAPSPQISNSTRGEPLPFSDANIASQFLGMGQQSAQTDLLRSQIQTQKTVQELNAMTSALRAVQTSGGAITNRHLEQSIMTGIQHKVKEMQEISSTVRLQTITGKMQTASTKKILDSNIREETLQRSSVKEIASRIAKNYQDITESKTRIGVNQSHQKNLDQDTLKKQIETEIQKWEDAYQKQYGITFKSTPMQRLQQHGMQWIEDLKTRLNNLLTNDQ